MAALLSMLPSSQIRMSGGDIMFGRRRVTRTEAFDLLAIWRTERVKAAEADDRPTYIAAKALHQAMLRAVLDADAWARASGAERFANAAMSVLGGRG